jgi:4-hydroxythreonine-4-phosphate dehydrogenase
MRPLAVSAGEPAGIGPELTISAWLERKAALLAPFYVIADPVHLGKVADGLSGNVPIQTIDRPDEAPVVFAEALPVLPVGGQFNALPGMPDSRDASLVIAAIETAVRHCLDGQAAGMVTNPISKAHLYAAGFEHPGHTEFIGALCGSDRQIMMLAGPRLKVVPATIHCALADVAARLSVDGLVRIGETTANALQRDFGIADPIIAFAGLNPHAGEGGAIGLEDRDMIRPAVESLKSAGIRATGPTAADSMFHDAARATYDAAICMYHDQALIPVKTLDFDQTVNVTLGLPVIRTSPDHGTAFDIAGKGVARSDSLISAIRMAGEMAHRRSA